MTDSDGFVERSTRRARNLNVGPGTRVNGAEKTKPRSSPAPKRSLENDIARALTYLNLGFFFLPPQFRQDALDPAEIKALSAALNKQAQANTRVYRLIESAVSGEITGQLVIVTLLIVSRRLARHGVIPAQFDQAGGELLSTDPEMLANFVLDADEDAFSDNERTATIIQ